jgi:hypothetical protein
MIFADKLKQYDRFVVGLIVGAAVVAGGAIYDAQRMRHELPTSRYATDVLTRSWTATRNLCVRYVPAAVIDQEVEDALDYAHDRLGK